jgi:hypothetical protein
MLVLSVDKWTTSKVPQMENIVSARAEVFPTEDVIVDPT